MRLKFEEEIFVGKKNECLEVANPYHSIVELKPCLADRRNYRSSSKSTHLSQDLRS